MVLRYHDGLIVLAKYDARDLVKTQRLLENQLAEHLGKPGGLPVDFNLKMFAAALSIALLNDLQDQYTEYQEVVKEEKRQRQSILDEIKELRDEHPNLSYDRWQSTLVKKYRNLKDTVEIKMPEIWPGLEFGISLLRILNIDDCTLPFFGILLGRPGSGKTVAITLLSKWICAYYTDDFSAKAWVTHTTAVNSEEELEAIDMLPKVKDRQFLTPELAMIFNLKEDDLRLVLSRIIRIVDGHGFASDSGVHGHRSYGNTMFTWLGAIVDIPYQVYKILGSLGPKLYYFRLPFEEKSETRLLKYLIDREDFNVQYQTIVAALFDYLKWFEIGPHLLLRSPDSPHLVKVRWEHSRNEMGAMKCLVKLATLLSYLRREGNAFNPDNSSVAYGEQERYEYFVGPREDVQRTVEVLKNLARGHALNTGLNYITMDDIPIVVKTVLSTARVERVKAFIAMLDTTGGQISVSQMMDALNVSRSTTHRWMTELRAIGLVDITVTNDIEFSKQTGNPTTVKVMSLRERFGWFLTDEFKKLRGEFTPVDNKEYIDEPDPEKEAATQEAKNRTHLGGRVR